MTQDKIIRMAREAGFEVVDGQLRLYFDGSKALLKPNYMGTVVDGLKTFAYLVAAHERENFLNKLDGVSEKVIYETVKEAVLAEREACAKVCDDKHDYMCSRAAAAIRARG